MQTHAAPFPFLLLERLPGTDLGHLYPQLSITDKRAIVRDLVRTQTRVHGLPLGKGFGYVMRYEAPFPHHTWREVIGASLARSRTRIIQAGVLTLPMLRVSTRSCRSMTPTLPVSGPSPF